MGIKNLHTLLRKYCPQIYITRELSCYRYKKLVIDASLYMFKYKTSAGERWLSCFVSLLTVLRKNEIHAIFVFDNGAPEEKTREKEERAASRNKIFEKALQIEDELREYDNNGTVSELLKEITNKYQNQKETRLLGTSRKSQLFDRKVVQAELDKLKKQTIHVGKEDFVLLRELCTIMNVPTFEAPQEAEKKCVELCLGGGAHGVITEDTDVLVYGAPVFLTHVSYRDGTCVEIALEDVLACLELTHVQFIDLCIMCGTDYNKNIYKIGPIKAYELIQKYGSIEEIEKMNPALDTSVLNYKRVRELFDSIEDKEPLPFCKIPDFGRLDMFLFENNSKVNIDGLKSHFEQRDLVFEE